MTASASGSDQLGEILRTYKENFWLERAHYLPEDQIQAAWRAQASNYVAIISGDQDLFSPPTALEKSVSQDARRSSYQTPRPAPQAASMVRNRTDQPLTLSRSHSLSQQLPAQSRKRRSNSSSAGSSPFKIDGRPTKTPVMTGQIFNGERDFAAGIPASPAKMQCTEATRSRAQELRIIPEIKEIDPSDYAQYVRGMNMADDSGNGQPIPRRNAPYNAGGRVPQSPALSASLSSSFESSQPTTPYHTAFRQPGTGAQGMSRQSSLGGSFMGVFNQMNIRQLSENSDSHVGAENSPFSSQPHNVATENCFVQFPECDSGYSLDYDGTTTMSDTQFRRLSHVDASAETKPDSFAEEDSRLAQSSSDEGTISPSQSRSSRRLQTQIAQSARTLAPKISDEEATRVKSDSMVHVNSDTGIVLEKRAISKSTYTRPQREKVKCNLCNEQPEGFRGEHELRRHTERAHKAVRKAWVCVDASPDKMQLANCKACKNGKLYGAYYNAAAHLRRVHFNPKPKTRRARGSGKSERAGHGGGDQPPMDYLKANWMKEVDEVVGSEVVDDEGQEDDSDTEPQTLELDDTEIPPTSEKESTLSVLHLDGPHFSAYSLAATTPSTNTDYASDVPRHSQLVMPDGLIAEMPSDLAAWNADIELGIFNFEPPLGNELF